MKSRAFGLALALSGLAAAGSRTAAPSVYVLDPDHTFVHFEVQHFGTRTARGRFGPVAGAVTLDRALGRGELGLRINTASVDTGIPVFNARLRQADLLASTEHPEAFFVAHNFRFDGNRVAGVRGEFTFRGTSQPLSLRARHFACRQDGSVKVCGGDFEAEILRSEFGASSGLPLIGDRVRLIVQLGFTNDPRGVPARDPIHRT